MELDRFVWFQPLGKMGREPLDLFACRQFIIPQPDPGDPCRARIFYLIDETGRWVDYTLEDEPYIGVDGWSTRFCESYVECNPITVAHEILQNKVFGSSLPQELEEYRKYGDVVVYRQWRKEQWEKSREGATGGRPSRPIWDGRCLMYGTILCKEFKKTAPNQNALIEAFDAKRWPPSVSVPSLDPTRLKETVDSMNSWEGSPLLFRQDGRKASWVVRTSKFKTSTTS